MDYTDGPDQTFVVDVAGGAVTTETIARIAFEKQVLLTELRHSDSDGLEQLFFTLTAADAAPTQEAAA